ncbi:invasion associated locus B family protein [Sphingobium sp. V4]|uniref:invasion associated locus B family protein n=1 Tax=Sphingobium sp. V4 TaxID=3038927 RepID=UPI002557CE64|nr:invasion associated locus B family protein [Sphingobium sp. V4]WIW87764.1 invasion associated locus B family protein [Sphingobium sp. V4]
MRRALFLSTLLLLCAAPAMARDSLGIFEGWGAFRDPGAGRNGPRCYAIAEPVVRRGQARRGFASVGNWPRQRVRGQVHIRLSRARAAQAAVTLSVGERRFTLVAGQVDAWAPDARTDAQIIAAMRSASSMSVQTVGADGRAFADSYALRGAATAVDAAALGCAKLR